MVLLKLSRDSLMPFNATAPVTVVRCFLLPESKEALSADRLRLEAVDAVVVVVLVDVWEMDVKELRSGVGVVVAGQTRSDEGREIGDEGGGIAGSSAPES